MWLAPFTPTPGHALAWGVAAAGMIQFVWLIVALHRADMPLRFSSPRLTPQCQILAAAHGSGRGRSRRRPDQSRGRYRTGVPAAVGLGLVSLLCRSAQSITPWCGWRGCKHGIAAVDLAGNQWRPEGFRPAPSESSDRIRTAPHSACGCGICRAGASLRVRVVQSAEIRAPRVRPHSAGLARLRDRPFRPTSLVKVLTPAYFARQDTVTPGAVGAICVVANLVLNLALMWWLKHVGLALATAPLGVAQHVVARAHFVPARWTSSPMHDCGRGCRGRCWRWRSWWWVSAVAHDGPRRLAVEHMFCCVSFCVVLLVLGGLGLFALSAYVTGAARPDDLRSFRPASNG